jgi:hypothetical protein
MLSMADVPGSNQRTLCIGKKLALTSVSLPSVPPRSGLKAFSVMAAVSAGFFWAGVEPGAPGAGGGRGWRMAVFDGWRWLADSSGGSPVKGRLVLSWPLSGLSAILLLIAPSCPSCLDMVM